MFTGIIQSTGTVSNLTNRGLTIESPEIRGEIRQGSSVSVDGVCLTVSELTEKGFAADVMPETYKHTTLGHRKAGSIVNVELAMPASGRFEGHVVSGHVEGVGSIKAIDNDGNSRLLTIELPGKLEKYVVPKGSIALNGISLTVVDVKDSKATVGIIPHTWKVTNLRQLRIGDKINIETDVMGKYVEKLLKNS
jgi:riboflavin synthase